MLRCPECGGEFLTRARVERLTEWLRSLVAIYPYRCRRCGHRFLAFGGRSSAPQRRRYPRVPLGGPVWFRLAPAARDQAYQGYGVLIDLSIGGCGFESAVPITGGIRLNLRLNLEEAAEPIEVEEAVVRHGRGSRFGVEFLDMSPRDKARLQELLKARAPEQFCEHDLN